MELVILVNAAGATGNDQAKRRTFRDRGKCKMKRMQHINSCDSDCADCRTVHGSEAEKKPSMRSCECAGSCIRPGIDGHTIS